MILEVKSGILLLIINVDNGRGDTHDNLGAMVFILIVVMVAV